MDKLRDTALLAGVREAEYWNMTVGEAVRACDAYHEQRRERAYFAYTEAMTMGLFIGSVFSNKHPPTLHEIFPDLFDENEEAEEERKDAASAANFINFANAFNRNFDNGDRKSESENNG